MLILTSLLALNYSSINKASYDISVNLNAPYDVQLFDDKQVFDEYIRVIEEEYTIVNTIEYNIYKEPNHQVQNFFQSEYYDFDPVLKLSDYNRLLELRKMPLLSLNDNEYYIVTNSKFAYKVEDNKDIETITVANKNLKLKGYDTKSYWNSITNTGRFVVVLPDKYVAALLKILDLNSSLGCAIASFKEPTLAKCTLIGFKSDLRLTTHTTSLSNWHIQSPMTAAISAGLLKVCSE